MDSIDDDAYDAGRHEIVEAGDASDGLGRSGMTRVPGLARMQRAFPEISSRSAALAVAVAGVALIGAAFVAWRSGEPPARVALAVPTGGIDTARGALARAGITAQFEDGALWVDAQDARRAAEAAAPKSSANAVATALEDESIFASGESSRARRLAATIKTLEATIIMQPGVERASVVVGDAPRSFAPGAASGATAAVTVGMRSGAMPQDLVDAVAVMVAGACQGVKPESVAIIDAVSGRVRTVRDVNARVMADIVHAREEHAAELVTALLADIPGVSVRVRESEGGAVVATVEVPRSVAVARAEAEAGGDMTQYMDLERSRIADRVEPFLTAPGSRVSAVALSIAPEPEWDRVAVTQPAEPYSVQSQVRTQVEASAARERATPLGSTNAANGFPYGWALLALGGLAGFAWWTWARPRGAARETNEDDSEPAMPAFDEEPLPGADASEAVRSAPEQSAFVVRGWIDTGDTDRAARLLVALDAGAAAAILQALPVTHVQRATNALGALDAPGHEELAEAVRSFFEDLEMAPEGGYRDAHEAA